MKPSKGNESRLQKLWHYFNPHPTSVRYFAVGAAGTLTTLIIGGRQALPQTLIYIAVVSLIVAIAYDGFRILLIEKLASERLSWLYYEGNDYFFPDLNDVERKAPKRSRIYIITPTLLLDVNNQQIMDTVDLNLRNETRYIFFTSRDSVANIREFARVHADHLSKVDVYRLDPQWMRLMATDNIMIIEPPSQPAIATGFIQIAAGNHKWWAQLDGPATAQYLLNVSKLIQRYETDTKELVLDNMPVDKVRWGDFTKASGSETSAKPTTQ